jgi:hypothetical protein
MGQNWTSEGEYYARSREDKTVPQPFIPHLPSGFKGHLTRLSSQRLPRCEAERVVPSDLLDPGLSEIRFPIKSNIENTS